MDVWPAARRFSWDCLARSLRCWTSASHSGNSSGPNRFRGKSSRTTRYSWGQGIRDIFPPPILLQGQQKGTGQLAHGDVVMPAGPGASFVLIEAHVTLLGLELGSMRQREPPT